MTKKLIALLLALCMVASLAACGGSGDAETTAPAGTEAAGTTEANDATEATEAPVAADPVKIGVLVADVSGEEALGFRAYYENYIAANYNVELLYSEQVQDAAQEKAAIEKFAAQGCQAIISLASTDRAMQIETCAQYELYYAIASGMLEDAQYETYKTNEFFVGQIGPSMDTEYEAGLAMGKYFAEKGVKSVAIYGAFIPNPMHVYRLAGTLVGLGVSYGGAADKDAIVGQIFGDMGLNPEKCEGDVTIAAYLQGFGDTTYAELDAAIQAAPDAFLSVGMATTFFTQNLNGAGIEFSDIDSFTTANGDAMTNGKLVYLAGKYSSCIGPVFAAVMNAVNGNVIRDAEGNALSISQGYLVATDAETFDKYYTADKGDSPIFSKEVLDTIIGSDITYDVFASVVEGI